MFSKDDKDGRQDHHDGVQMEAGTIKGWSRNPSRGRNAFKGDNAETIGNGVTAHHADEDGNDADKALPQEGRKDGDDERCRRNLHGLDVRHALYRIHKACHVHGHRCKFKADDGDNGPHGSRRKEYINPLGPDFLHKKAHKDETEPKSNEASLRVPVRKARRVRNGKDRRNKGKA